MIRKMEAFAVFEKHLSEEDKPEAFSAFSKGWSAAIAAALSAFDESKSASPQYARDLIESLI